MIHLSYHAYELWSLKLSATSAIDPSDVRRSSVITAGEWFVSLPKCVETPV